MLTFKIPSLLCWVNNAKISSKPVLTCRCQLAESDMWAPVTVSQTGHQTLQEVSDGRSCATPKVLGVVKETAWLPLDLLLALSSKRKNFVQQSNDNKFRRFLRHLGLINTSTAAKLVVYYTHSRTGFCCSSSRWRTVLLSWERSE